MRTLTNGATLVGLLVLPDPGHHVVRVPQHLPDHQLHCQGAHEAKYPVIDLVCSPDQMEEMSQRQDVDVVAVQQSLGFVRSVILPGRFQYQTISLITMD